MPGASKTYPPILVTVAATRRIQNVVEAAQNGFDETIFLDHRGFVSEGSGENIFIVGNETLHTPPLPSGILERITRDAVRTIALGHDLKVQERDIALAELCTCDEAFFTGTSVSISPIVSIDRRKIGDGNPGAVTRKVQNPIPMWFRATTDSVLAG